MSVEDRKCLTPETYYEFGMETDYTLVIRVRFPFKIHHWATGTSNVKDHPELEWESDASRLARYDERAEGVARVSDLIHDALEPVMADAYRVMQEIDQRLGESHVQEGINGAKRRRERAERARDAKSPAALLARLKSK